MFTSLKKYGIMFATVSSAVCFGIMHSSPTQTMYAIVFGIFSCIFVVVSGNIKTSILFHAINNFTIYLQSIFEGTLSDNVFYIYYTIYIAAVCVLAIFGLWKFFEKDGVYEKFAAIARKDSETYEFLPGIAEVFNPAIILILIIYVSRILLEVVL